MNDDLNGPMADSDAAYDAAFERAKMQAAAEMTARVVAAVKAPNVAGDAARMAQAAAMAMNEPNITLDEIAARFPRQDAPAAIPKAALANRSAMPDSLDSLGNVAGKAAKPQDNDDAMGAAISASPAGAEYPDGKSAGFIKTAVDTIYANRKNAGKAAANF